MKTSLKLTLSLMGLLASSAAYGEEKVVNVSFWYQYLSDENIASFAKESGIKIVYDSFNAVEMLTTKVLTGNSNYDVVMPSAALVGQYVQAGAIQKLDKSKIPNLKDIDPALMEFLAPQDPTHDYAVPYAYGSTGILYDREKIKARMGDAPVDSWDMVFKPAIAQKFADCGIVFSDTPDQMTAIALNYLGLDPFTKNPEDFKKAEDLLLSVRPFVRHFNTDAIQQEMISGDVCLAVTWTGTAVYVQDALKASKTDRTLDFTIPKEGSDIFFDVMTVPVDAPHPEYAFELINFLISAKAAANFSNTYQFPSGVMSAKALLNNGVAENPNIYLPVDVIARLWPDQPRGPEEMRRVVRSWTRFKSGT